MGQTSVVKWWVDGRLTGVDDRMMSLTYINLRVYDVYETAKHYDEIKYIPRITKVILLRKTPNEKNIGLFGK